MDDRKLKEYAVNIYNGISGYSLSKASTLFPKYFPKIAFYYFELLTNDQKELTTRAIQLLGLNKAREMREQAIAANEEMERYEAAARKEIIAYYKYTAAAASQLYERQAITYQKYSKILMDVRDIAIANESALKTIGNTATQYGFLDIHAESIQYLNKNTELLNSVINTEKYYTKKLEEL